MTDAKSDLFERQHLELVFQNVLTTNGIFEAMNVSVGATTDLNFDLYDDDPGETGDPTINRLSYSGYNTLLVSRSASNFAVVNPSGHQWLARNAVKFTFNAKKLDVGSVTATWGAVWVETGGVQSVLYKGQITTPAAGLVIAQNTNPVINAQAWTTEER